MSCRGGGCRGRELAAHRGLRLLGSPKLCGLRGEALDSSCWLRGDVRIYGRAAACSESPILSFGVPVTPKSSGMFSRWEASWQEGWRLRFLLSEPRARQRAARVGVSPQ